MLLASLALGGASALLLLGAGSSLSSALGPAGQVDDAVAGLAAGAGGALAAAWALGALLVATARLAPSASGGAVVLHRLGRRLLPTLLRTALVAALGAGPLAAAAPALAAPAATATGSGPAAARGGPTVVTDGDAVVEQAPSTDPGTSTGVDVDASGTGGSAAGLPSAPDVTWRPTTPPRPKDAAGTAAESLVVPAPRPHVDGPRQVVVVRGDTLWDIAARALPAGADDAEVAAAWPAWYAANRHVVGDDPDLLLPGQVLHAPADGVAR